MERSSAERTMNECNDSSGKQRGSNFQVTRRATICKIIVDNFFRFWTEFARCSGWHSRTFPKTVFLSDVRSQTGTEGMLKTKEAETMELHSWLDFIQQLQSLGKAFP